MPANLKAPSLTKLLGHSHCCTPGCSEEAEVWQIGRYAKLVCQNCGGCWELKQWTLKKWGMKWVS